MKEPSLETKLHQAKEEGKKLAQQAKGRGNPAFTPPDSLPLMQEKEPNKFEVVAFKLEEFLKSPLVYTDDEGKKTIVAESMEQVFEGEEGKKRLKVLGQRMAISAQRAMEGGGTSMFLFLTTYTSLKTLPQELQQTTLHAFKEHSGRKTFEDVLPGILPVLGQDMARDAQRATEGLGGSALNFLTSYTSLLNLPQELQQTTLDTFKTHFGGKTFEEVLPDILLVLGKVMAKNAQHAVEGNGYSARHFLHTYASLPSLSPELQQITLNAFKKHSEWKTFEEVLPSILPALGEEMARDAQFTTGNTDAVGAAAWRFFRALTSLNTLTTRYHKLANEQKKEEELHTTNKKTTEPIISPKNF